MATVTRERTGLASDAVRELRDRFVPRGLSVGTPVVVARALGSEVWDPEGKRYLDFVAGIGALNLGHQHPDVTAAVREQLERYTHVSAQVVTYEPYVRLAQELDRIYPRGDAALATKSVFANSGAEAVENSMKIARVATGRGRLHRAAGALPEAHRSDLPPSRHPVHRRRDPDGHGAHRPDVRDRAQWRDARSTRDEQVARRGLSDRRGHRPRGPVRRARPGDA